MPIEPRVLVIAIILLIAVITDIRVRRIPNWLNFSGMLSAIAFHGYVRGWEGVAFSVEGMLLGIGLLIVFYLAGGMGAGDVKLLGAVGAWLGPIGVFTAFLCIALVGGAYSVISLYRSGSGRDTILRYVSIFKHFLWTGRFSYVPPSQSEKIPDLHYGIAIALGTGLSIYFPL